MKKILVYASDEKDFDMFSDGYELNIAGFADVVFRDLNSDCSFDSYDGVILFNGIWANQIDLVAKKHRELNLLLAKGGFVVFLIDSYEFEIKVPDLLNEVLQKFPLFINTIYPDVDVQILYPEIKDYSDKYGIPKTGFMINNKNGNNLDINVLLRSNSFDKAIYGFCLNRNIYVLPFHVTNPDIVIRNSLVDSLIKGIIPLHKNMDNQLPSWIANYHFSPESNLLKDKIETIQKIEGIDRGLMQYDKYKRILIDTSSNLKNSVADVLEAVFSLEIDRKDDNIQDLKIINKSDLSQDLAVVECKGINGNVQRDHINQVDSHRERNNFPEDFPGILIANTFKSSDSWIQKNRNVEPEQIKHAVKMKVLIIRTVDLLKAINIILEKPERKSEFNSLLLKEIGWLEVTETDFIVHRN